MQTLPKIDCVLASNGRLENLADWNDDVAEALAKMDGLTLTPAHWEIINVVRDYPTYNISPIKKLLKKEIREKLGSEKSSDACLDKLFPTVCLLKFPSDGNPHYSQLDCVQP